MVAGVRDLSKASALSDQGVEIRIADYSRPDTLPSAFAGIDRLLLISSSENGRRKPQHRAVIDAAKAAGVKLIAYTSILHADTSQLLLADEHRDTEAALAESGVPHVLLRNGWYTEVYTWRLPLAFKQGMFMGAAGDGRISSAARADYAQAAATVLVGDGHAGRTYELAGDDAFTLTDLARVVSDASGAPMTYRNMTPEAYEAAGRDAGMPDVAARIVADTDAGVSNGALFDDRHMLSRLIGRPTTPFAETIGRFVRDRQSAGDVM